RVLFRSKSSSSKTASVNQCTSRFPSPHGRSASKRPLSLRHPPTHSTTLKPSFPGAAEEDAAHKAPRRRQPPLRNRPFFLTPCNKSPPPAGKDSGRRFPFTFHSDHANPPHRRLALSRPPGTNRPHGRLAPRGRAHCRTLHSDRGRRAGDRRRSVQRPRSARGLARDHAPFERILPPVLNGRRRHRGHYRQPRQR